MLTIYQLISIFIYFIIIVCIIYGIYINIPTEPNKYTTLANKLVNFQLKVEVCDSFWNFYKLDNIKHEAQLYLNLGKDENVNLLFLVETISNLLFEFYKGKRHILIIKEEVMWILKEHNPNFKII